MRYLQLLAVLLLATVWGVAQDYPSQTNSTQTSQATPVNAGGEDEASGAYWPRNQSHWHHEFGIYVAEYRYLRWCSRTVNPLARGRDSGHFR